MMKGTLSKVLIFAAGAAIGSVATWKICKDRYEARIQEEIESVKEKFSVKKEEIETENEDEEGSELEVDSSGSRVIEKPDLKEYAKLLERYRSNIPEEEADPPKNDSDEEEEYIPDEVEEVRDGIYPIKPEIFGDDEYETEYFTLYADNVLADGRDLVVEKPENQVGYHYQDYFGIYEEDLVCIRNEELKTDYEITRDSRRYGDMYTTPNALEEDNE